jgi:hypothetical protein
VRRGCVAVAALPVLALAAPVVAWRRRGAVRRRGERLALSVSRGVVGGFARLRVKLDVPTHRLGEVAAALGGAVGEGACWAGRTVGCVGIVAGDDPVLVAVAPARDVVAARVRETLGRGRAHRRPELWLTLPDGRYLAEVVDPYSPFADEEPEIVALLRTGEAGHALRAEVSTAEASVVLALTLYAPRADLRKLFTLSRSVLAVLPGWSRTR